MAHIKNHLFFSGLDEDEIRLFLNFSEPKLVELEPGQKLELGTGRTHSLGVVIMGDIRVYCIDYSGEKLILNAESDSDSVGTMQFMMEYYNMLYEISSKNGGSLLLLSPDSLLITDKSISAVQHKILVNVMASQRQLFIDLSEHIVCLSQKNIRDKILRYLKIQCDKNKAYEFEIIMSREELASYLAVDRASLSRSLGELKKDGIIDFRKNRFTILDTRCFKF
jgi:CRP-like cAMP-binding protein